MAKPAINRCNVKPPGEDDQGIDLEKSAVAAGAMKKYRMPKLKINQPMTFLTSAS